MRHDPIDPKLFIENRQRLKKLLLPNSLALLNANDIPATNADGSRRLTPNSDLFYLTGIEQEESIFLFFPEADDEKQREILFLREANPEMVTWEGHKLTKEDAQRISGVNNIQWLQEFPRTFHRLMCECEHVYLNSNEHKRAVVTVESRDARFVAETIRKYPLHEYHRLARLMHQLRVVKSPEEVALIKQAVSITGKAFERVLGMVKPGVTEAEIEAEFAHEFIRNRADFAYTPIIASGKNSCVLHYIENNAVCKKGDLLLLDVAACYANYNSDLTRTISVSGTFSRRQRQVYQAVQRVLQRSIQGLTPGKRWKKWQEEAESMLEAECVDLGLLKARDLKRRFQGNPPVKKYFMHGIGHPLGLDVHDLGFTTEPMEAGWVMTVEPGIYIPEEGFGIRLENDVVITENGPLDLMENIPLDPQEIASRMAQK